MKILFDYKIFYQQKYGGISNYFCNLGKELIKLNQEILFCTPIHKNQYLNSLEKNNIYGKYVNFLPHYLNFIFENFNHSNTNKIIKSYKPNIIHETYYSTKEYSNKKIICTVYDLINEKFSNYFKNSQQIYEIKKKTLNRANQIICISKNTKKDLLHYYDLDEKKIHITLLASNFKEINNQNKKLQSKLLFVGSRYGYKNFEKFIAAYSSSEILKKNFQIIAYGGEKFSNVDKKIFKKYNLSSDKISFENDTSFEVEYLYSNCAALIYPSMYEGFGIPIIEAMRCGCPIISSSGGALKEIGGPGLEYFEPNNIESMKENILKVLSSQSTKDKITKYGYKRAKEFSWEKCAAETLEIYQKTLQS